MLKNMVTQLDALGEILIPVLASADGCRAYEYWVNTFAKFEGDTALYVSGEFETIDAATFYFSIISLRKIDEFLSDGKKKNPDDIRYSDFGISKKSVLRERDSIISQNVRGKINKCVAHSTLLGHPQVEDLEEFDRALEQAKPALMRLEDEITRLLRPVSRNAGI